MTVDSIPSFDEWFAAKHGGSSFEHIYMTPGAMIQDAMVALTVEMREYVTAMTRQTFVSGRGS